MPNSPQTSDSQFNVVCGKCGERFTRHVLPVGHDCTPRWLFFWPREHPVLMALFAGGIGLGTGAYACALVGAFARWATTP